MPGIQASFRSAPWLAFASCPPSSKRLDHWICCPQESLPRVQKRNAQNIFWKHKGAHANLFRDQQNHDSQRRDRILRCFLHPESPNSPHLQREAGEKGKQSTSGDGARNCRFLSLVVVERVLSVSYFKQDSI